MDFPSVDLFDDDVDDTPRVDHADLARKEYKAKVCPLGVDMVQFSTDRDGMKMQADLAYYKKEYQKSKVMYKELYMRSDCNSLSVRRDVAECLARSCLALGEFREAVRLWGEIMEGWAGHDDQRLVVGQLRIDIARQEGDWGQEVGATICNMIEMHNTLAKYWGWLADWYREKGEVVKEFWCLVRAKEVGRMEGVKSSVDSEQMECRMKQSQAEQNLKQKIVEVVCRDFRDKIEEDEEVVKEFEDLGTSVRIKKVEEALAEQKVDTGSNEEDLNVIKLFEEK